MKRSSIIGIGAIAFVASAAFATQIPVVANFLPGGSAIAQNAKKGQVKLELKAAKKIVQQNKAGKQEVSWKALEGNVAVQPGDVLRYTVTGANNGDKPVKNLAINQPISKGMKYVLNSATVDQNKGAKIVYSINGGKTFVENPTVQVKLPNGELETRPAPAEAYTHVRCQFGESVAAKANVNCAYQAEVR
ncbi:MAG: hypothetical protein QNJ47_14210 [Nostocaceae cyanobacterium]|nr:hypothetical protein [Nostocaceae cyanobacterium]